MIQGSQTKVSFTNRPARGGARALVLMIYQSAQHAIRRKKFGLIKQISKPAPLITSNITRESVRIRLRQAAAREVGYQKSAEFDKLAAGHDSS